MGRPKRKCAREAYRKTLTWNNSTRTNNKSTMFPNLTLTELPGQGKGKIQESMEQIVKTLERHSNDPKGAALFNIARVEEVKQIIIIKKVLF